ncbi:uncharacterized protein LOC135488412 isoform X2 [Lineus longissimus]|uniref:Excitatory peptide variant 2 n=1 Tax=Lineus longissimus TaxID=88925 RepID=A0A517FL77_LINLO|nr:excitatory peptide variant 2 precursor [Lineus longissimus]
MSTYGVWSLLVLVFIYLCLGSYTVAGSKCKGRWAIHACAAGNGGKRSDPRLQIHIPSERQRTLQDMLEILRSRLLEDEANELEEEELPTYETTENDDMWNRLYSKLKERQSYAVAK